MRIATFNINGVVRRLPNLLAWLAEATPDAVCLQELKVAEPDFPVAALEDAGYGAVWTAEGRWNGVAILAREAVPVLTRAALPGEPRSRQRRYVEAAVGGVLVASIYAPNGNPRPGAKFDAKLAWYARLAAHAQNLLAEGVPVVLAGDWNVVPERRDIYETTSYDGDALVDPAVRQAFAAILGQGWRDALRQVHPEATLYTFWDYRRRRWTRDAGLRLDHLLVSPDLVPAVADAGIDRAVRGREGASDHAPVWIDLAR